MCATLDLIISTHKGSRAYEAEPLRKTLTLKIIVCIVMFSIILGKTKSLSDFLQNPSIDLGAAADLIDSVLEELKAIHSPVYGKRWKQFVMK